MMRILTQRPGLSSALALTTMIAAATAGVAVTRAGSGANATKQVVQATETAPRNVDKIKTAEGFKVELLHETDKSDEGSWVALTAGPGNTLYASAQYRQVGRGKDAKQRKTLYHIVPPKIGDKNAKTKVIPQPIDLNGAQGLCWAFDALYVMESGVGVQKVTDSDGDGLLDKKQLLLAVKGGGEHGTHAIVKTHDGKGLYIVGGNMTPMPKFQASKVPVLWDEDQTLPRERDARGHAAGLKAPGGWIGRIDPDGKNLTIICNGFRNQYDMDVAPNGEIFAYDADMEWDLGLPWYRPTRINHVTSGAEFGWRNGSGKWPAYFEDSLASVVDIGPGSPVGVVFGTGAKFPTKYQKALFVLDWTYGIIYAVHMKPDGASYTGELEQFVVGKPLPVTDVTIADDGAMYFTTGGRRGNSALYRVRYTGDADLTPPPVEPLTVEAKLRRQLETLHAPNAGADKLDMIWEMLDRSDRHVRFAARVALEHLKPELYAKRAAAEKDALTRTSAGLALARHKAPAAADVLAGVDLKDADDVTKLAWLRAVGVHFARSGQPAPAVRKVILDKLNSLKGGDNTDIDTEIVRVGIFIKDPAIIGYALDLMNNTAKQPPAAWMKLAAQNDRYGAAIRKMQTNPPPTFQVGIAFMLRNVKQGWTVPQLQSYFGWLNSAAVAGGGNSYQGYIANIRKQVVAMLSNAQKQALGSLMDPPIVSDRYPVVAPKGPAGKWTVEKATRLIKPTMLKNRDFMKGVGLFQSAQCSQCHRVGDFGGLIGPDLTPVAGKFGIEDFMRATIEPNHEISDQFALTEVTKKDGKKVVGVLVDKNAKEIILKPNPRAEELVKIPAGDVKSMKKSELSTMPAGLITPLSRNELLDLVAYIYSKGEPDAKNEDGSAMFKSLPKKE